MRTSERDEHINTIVREFKLKRAGVLAWGVKLEDLENVQARAEELGITMSVSSRSRADIRLGHRRVLFR